MAVGILYAVMDIFLTCCLLILNSCIALTWALVVCGLSLQHHNFFCMKKLFIPILAFLMIFTAGCNNSTDNKTDNTAKAQEDSVFRLVMDGHNVGMAKMGKLSKAQIEVKRLLDSISKLPASAVKAAEPLKSKLDTLLKDLGNAESGMNKWMEDFSYDTLKTDLKERINYLSNETISVNGIKEKILGSLQKADSLLHKKF